MGFYIPTGTSAPLSNDINDYPEGIVIPVDKPYRWTSADVIRKIKYAAIRHFGKKNLKVGHAGTLDPLATGVLLVCIGNATKMAEQLQAHDKEYLAGITFGATTPSYDREKEIDRFFPFGMVTREAIQDVLGSFIGEQEQVAPLFSAKSVDGVRAYEIARKMFREGGSLDEAARELVRTNIITISELELIDFHEASKDSDRLIEEYVSRHTDDCQNDKASDGKSGKEHGNLPPEGQGKRSGASSRINVTDNTTLGLPQAIVRMACTKGTYVRAFARDLGEALDTGAHLDALRRTRSGAFSASSCLSVDQAISLLQPSE